MAPIRCSLWILTLILVLSFGRGGINALLMDHRNFCDQVSAILVDVTSEEAAAQAVLELEALMPLAQELSVRWVRSREDGHYPGANDESNRLFMDATDASLEVTSEIDRLSSDPLLWAEIGPILHEMNDLLGSPGWIAPQENSQDSPPK